jgi:hypothetical protein
MSQSEKSFEFFKKSSHRFPKKLFRLVNEGFEVTRGYIASIRSNSKEIRHAQRIYLQQNFAKDAKGLIIFLTPGIDMVNGGILSINSLFEVTKHLINVHGSEAILCAYPSDPPLLKYTKFKNNSILLNFSDSLNFFKNLENLIIHVPEHFIYRFYWFISKKDRDLLSKIKNVQINILIQNIDFLPSNKYIMNLRRFGKLTGTTAHTKYSTIELRNSLGFPLHKLSAYVSPEQYRKRKYSEKQDLMIVSPDHCARKSEILLLIQSEFPQLRVKIIRNLTYEEYKETISYAKWALTFGEGLDGYFVEPVFSGAISFSVYKPEFFTKEFQILPTVYSNYDVFKEKICSDIRELDNKVEFDLYQRQQFELCAKEYNYANYIKNLELFYEGKYTFN